MADHYPWCRTPCPGGEKPDLQWPPRMITEHRGPTRVVESHGNKACVWIFQGERDEPAVAITVGERVAAGYCRLDAEAAIRFALAIIDEAQKIGGKVER